MSVRPGPRWATPAGSCTAGALDYRLVDLGLATHMDECTTEFNRISHLLIVLNTASQRTAKCLLMLPLAEATILITPFSLRLELENMYPGLFSSILNLRLSTKSDPGHIVNYVQFYPYTNINIRLITLTLF